MTGDLRTRVAEWLVDMFGDSPDFALRHADDLISRVLDADPDTPTADAPANTVIAGCGHYCSVCGQRERFAFLRDGAARGETRQP